MKQRPVLILLSLLLFALPGCQSSKAVGSSGAESTGAERATIQYSSMWTESDPQSAIIKDAVLQFENDTGNRVNITWHGRDIESTLPTLLENEETAAPDIWEQDFSRQVRQYGDYMLDLTDYYNQPWPALGGQTPRSYLSTDLTDLVFQLSDGAYLGVPYQPFGVLFFYNRAHFEQAGIEKAPETWAEFTAACAALKDAGFTPFAFDDSYLGLHMGYYLARLKGAEWVAGLMNGEESFADPAVRQMAEAYQAMRDAGYFDVSGGIPHWPEGQKQLAESNTSMYLTGTWLPNETVSKPLRNRHIYGKIV